MPGLLPTSGQASTYGSQFVGRPTAYLGDRYSHTDYTAALLPRSRKQAVTPGTRLRLTHEDRKVVVKINDWGAGDGSLSRVLDLSRIAMAWLTHQSVADITDRNASVIQLSLIEIVPQTTPLGPA